MVIAYNMEQFVSNHFKHLNFIHFVQQFSIDQWHCNETATFGSIMGSDGYCSINQRTRHITVTIKLFDWLASLNKTKESFTLGFANYTMELYMTWRLPSRTLSTALITSKPVKFHILIHFSEIWKRFQLSNSIQKFERCWWFCCNSFQNHSLTFSIFHWSIKH